MKNLLLTACFFLFILQIQAQQIALYEEPDVKVNQTALNWENQKLRSDLTLNDKQFEQIKEINLERSKARNIVVKMFKYEPKKREAKVREIESQFDGEFEEILTEKQFKKFLSLQGRRADNVVETETTNQQVEEPNFNARIQEMISKATAPVIDPTLLPQQDTTSQEIIAGNSNSLQIPTSGSDQKNNIKPDPARNLELLVPAPGGKPAEEKAIDIAEESSNKLQITENNHITEKINDNKESEEKINKPQVSESTEPGE